jgi:hypothetical protein
MVRLKDREKIPVGAIAGSRKPCATSARKYCDAKGL